MKTNEISKSFHSAMIGWLNAEEVETANKVAFYIAEMVSDGKAGEIDADVIGTFNALRDKSEANFIEWLNEKEN